MWTQSLVWGHRCSRWRFPWGDFLGGILGGDGLEGAEVGAWTRKASRTEEPSRPGREQHSEGIDLRASDGKLRDLWAPSPAEKSPYPAKRSLQAALGQEKLPGPLTVLS